MAWHSWRTDALVDVEILRNLRKEIENLVHDGCLQEVCHLLSDFGSKIRIKVTHILPAT